MLSTQFSVSLKWIWKTVGCSDRQHILVWQLQSPCLVVSAFLDPPAIPRLPRPLPVGGILQSQTQGSEWRELGTDTCLPYLSEQYLDPTYYTYGTESLGKDAQGGGLSSSQGTISDCRTIKIKSTWLQEAPSPLGYSRLVPNDRPSPLSKMDDLLAHATCTPEEGVLLGLYSSLRLVLHRYHSWMALTCLYTV